MTKIKILVALITLLTLTSTSYAQFGTFIALKNAITKETADEESQVDINKDSADPSAAPVDPSLVLGLIGAASGDVATEDLMGSFIASYIHLVDAQTSFAKSLDMQDRIQELEAHKLALTSGTFDKDTKGLKVVTSYGASVNIDIKTRLSSKPILDQNGSENFSSGLISYFLALNEARNLSLSLRTEATGVLSGGLTGAFGKIGKIGATAFVAKESPGYLKDLVTTGAMLIEFSKANDIEVPDNATALLSLL